MRTPGTRGWPALVLVVCVLALLALTTERAGEGSARVFLRLSEEGAELGADAPVTRWACSVDTRTELTWEVKTRDRGLRDARWTYTPYDSNPLTSGGWTGYRDTESGECVRAAMAGRSCNTEAYVEAINARGLCGYSDWRLPRMSELVAVASQTSSAPPRADGAMLPNIFEGWYWTGVEQVGVSAFSRVILLPPGGQPSWYDGSYLLVLVRSN